MKLHSAPDRRLRAFVKHLIHFTKKLQRSERRATLPLTIMSAGLVACLAAWEATTKGFTAGWIVTIGLSFICVPAATYTVLRINHFGDSVQGVETPARIREFKRRLHPDVTLDTLIECAIITGSCSGLHAFTRTLVFQIPHGDQFAIHGLVGNSRLWMNGKMVNTGWTQKELIHNMCIVLNPANTEISIAIANTFKGDIETVTGVGGLKHEEELMNKAANVKLCATVINTLGNNKVGRTLFLDVLNNMNRSSSAEILDAATATMLALDPVDA